MPAVPTHHTDTTSRAWDGPEQEKHLRTPLTVAIGNRAFAYRKDGADPANKSTWSYIHHMVGVDGQPGDANVKGCTSAIGYLNGAGGQGTGVPEDQRRAVYDHLVAHLRDAGTPEKALPELKAANPVGVQQARLARADLAGHIEHRRPGGASRFELREVPNGTGGTNLRFTGYASVSEAPYEMEDWLGPWTETIAHGAFKNTLAQGADVAFLINHEGMSLARTKSGTLKLSEDDIGLHVEALLDPQNPLVQQIRSATDRGDLDEMSFAFRVLREKWNKDYNDRRIQEVSLDKGDVSLVNYGANPHTGGLVTLRQLGRGGRRTYGSQGEPSPEAGEVDPCPRCNGEGQVHLRCPQCGGSGAIESDDTGNDGVASEGFAPIGLLGADGGRLRRQLADLSWLVPTTPPDELRAVRKARKRQKKAAERPWMA